MTHLDFVSILEHAPPAGNVPTDREPFIELGGRARTALAAGPRAEAGTLLAGFDRFAPTFGPDLAEVRKKLWARAARAFAECRRLRPADPARVFEERVARLGGAPPPADWDGAWRLAEK